MNRRELMLVLSGAMVARPLAARAQQKALPVIGYLGFATPATNASTMAAFRRGLSEAGYVEGQDVAIEYRWAERHYDRLPALAAELVGRKVDVIAANDIPSARAARSETSSIPIFFIIGGDPVAEGLVTSLRPAHRQHHRRYFYQHRADAQAARAAFRTRSPGESSRSPREPEQSEYRGYDERHAGSGAR